jgi:hypothetical protein
MGAAITTNYRDIIFGSTYRNAFFRHNAHHAGRRRNEKIGGNTAFCLFYRW